MTRRRRLRANRLALAFVLVLTASFCLAPLPVLAQSGMTTDTDHAHHHSGAMKAAPEAKNATVQPSMPGMDHSKMDHGSTHSNASTMPADSPSAMNHAGTDGGQPGENAGEAEMAGMDHGDMHMQGGPAPADARDPHAYSDGYVLDSGIYAMPGTRQLRLADEHSFGSVLFDRLQRVGNQDVNATSYDAQAWFGRDYNRLVVKAEGEVSKGKLQDARTELLWGHAIAPYWDTQLGARYDSGTGPDRSWLAFGFQGLAPYWFETSATAYVSGSGRTALRLEAEYEILLTQKLILQPHVEVNLYGKDDDAREIGSGLSTGVAGLRLRYEISRQFAPYIGVERASKYGRTADMARASGESTAETLWVAGVRFWF